MYSNTDRSQLLTIACSQEHEERNKIMAQQRQQQHFVRSLFPAQAGASKLKLSRQILYTNSPPVDLSVFSQVGSRREQKCHHQLFAD